MYPFKFTIRSGNIDDDTVFTYETDTEVDASCAATLHDEFWVIGGKSKKRQVIMKLLKLHSKHSFS